MVAAPLVAGEPVPVRAATMRAAVFHGPGRPLRLEEVPLPEPGPGEVRVRVAACGVCHTDLHYVDHGTPTFKEPPLILGHEASGRVDALGPGVSGWTEGEPVLLPAVLTCGSCRFCRLGRENVCAEMRMFGNHVDGAYAEYVLAPARDLFRLPPAIPLEEGCIIADALSTPYHAVKNRGQVRPGDTVAVFGVGGVGINVVQIAAAVGARVIAVDQNPERLTAALSLGASEAVDASRVERPEKEVRSLTGGGVDVAFEAIGKASTLEAAFASVRRGGRLCVIGYSSEVPAWPASKVMFHEMEIVGSLGCRPVDYPPLIDMIARGRLQLAPLVTARFPLERINEALDHCRQGKGIRGIVVP
jgi:6-hydroxycyclohex-1-ene-1-carbonyl-CoA dehydrogenase